MNRNAKKVFSCGIGTGWPIECELKKNGIVVDGCDVAEKSVEIAQISLDNYDGIYTGVIQDYKGPKGEYDVVYCMRASWCISGFEEVIIKMADMCREKGTIIFDIMPVEKYSIFKEIINRNFLKWVGVVKIDSPEFCYYSLNKIKKSLER